MCGLAGVYSPDNKVSTDHLDDMGMAIFARGPDSSGIWSDNENIGLVHRRLAIVDVSAAGNQPMHSVSQRFVIAFNGEIYNHLALRAELDAIAVRNWQGYSDTETLLAAIEQWGLSQTLVKVTGMFALALWDKHTKQLQLARDRFGEKPLYYGWQNGYFLFGSQLNALRPHPAFTPEINRNAITLLLRHNCIPAPYSIYKNIYKLLPGTIITINGRFEEATEVYWSAKETMALAAANQITLPESEQLEQLEQTLKNAIAGQMVADVPLGAFLSGGVDSSLIVALMQQLSNKPVKTFSIGFNDKRFNEAEFARAVADHLGTEHTDLYITAEDALAVIPKLVDIYDEPFSDSSQIPTYLVSKIAKQHVTVSLSGDAGDEVFCGYNRYMLTARTWHKLSRVPVVLRKMAAWCLTAIPINAWNSLSVLVPARWRLSNMGDKLHKAGSVLASSNIEKLYLGLVSHWQHPESVVLNSHEPLTALTDPKRKANFTDPIMQMMAQDTLSYLADDILVKVDRAAMAVSLETRVPFLDHTLFEHAWRLPMAIKIKGSKTKWCLRKILYKYVPEHLIERPKMGFAVPLDVWLRGPLKEWADALLTEQRLQQESFFDVKKVRNMWLEHLSGKRNWQYQLWDILMFQAWYEKYHK